MIRLHRVETFGALPAQRPPLLKASSRNDLELKIRESEGLLTPGELSAVARAITGLRDGEDADILLSADGALFRVERGLGASLYTGGAAAPGARPALDWTAGEVGARVLVAHEEAEFNRRAREALSFLGYAAEALEGGAGDAPRVDGRAVERAILELQPVAVLVDERLLHHALQVVSEVQPRRRPALVALHRSDVATVPRGADAVLPLPLRLADVAGVIDGAIRGRS